METTLTFPDSILSMISTEVVDANTARTVYRYGYTEITVTSIFDGAQKLNNILKSIALDNLSHIDLNHSEQEVAKSE